VTVKAIFLDKDGTLIENVPYNTDPSRVRLTPGAGPAAQVPVFMGKGRDYTGREVSVTQKAQCRLMTRSMTKVPWSQAKNE